MRHPFVKRAKWSRITDLDLKYLQRCVDLTQVALENGDEPFGSLLVAANGDILEEDYNHVSGGDHIPSTPSLLWPVGQLIICYNKEDCRKFRRQSFSSK